MREEKRNENPERDEFEDLFSTSPSLEDTPSAPQAEDEYEDLFSNAEPADDRQDLYEDVSSGRKDVPTHDRYDGFFTQSPLEEEPQESTAEHREINTNPQKMPYRYNENAPRRTRARNGDEIVLTEEDEAPKKPKKKHLGLKIFACILAVILLAVGTVGGLAYQKAQALLKTVTYAPLKENTHIAAADLLQKPYLTNILLIGVDARSGQDAEKTRSDTMMLVTIDTEHKQIKLTSFLRDLYVDIPDYRADKINAAQSHGGTQLLVDTIETNFKVDIDSYMLVNFDMFTQIIDALGGVEVDITKKEAKYINSRDHMTDREKAAYPKKIEAGVQTLTGEQALWYARIRYLDSDFMRTERQRKVMTAIAKAAKGKSFEELYTIAQTILPMLRTDLEPNDMMRLGMHAVRYLQYDIVQMQVPLQDAYKSERKRGMSVLVPDLQKNVSALHGFLENKVQTEETTEKA